jgi:hypothetical protein
MDVYEEGTLFPMGCHEVRWCERNGESTGLEMLRGRLNGRFISDRGSHFTVLLVGFEWLVNCCLIPSLCCCKEDVVLSVGAFLPEVFTRRSNTSRERVSPLPLIFWRVTLPHSCFTVDSMAFLLSAMWIIGHANRSPQFRTLTFQVCLRNVKNCTFYKIDVRFV